MASKPTVIFVPGAWHTPEGYGKVMGLLEKEGYKCIGVNLASVGAEPPLKDTSEDIKVIRNAIASEVEQEHDVVVAVHSYGGVPGCDAIKGFTRADQEAKGKKGGVVKLLFICAFALPEGMSLMDGLGGTPLPWFDVKGDELRPIDPRNIFYNDLDEETAKHWIAKLKVHSWPTLSSKLSYAAWQHVSSAYLLCEADQAIPIHAQEGMASSMASERCTAGHSPFMSQPEVTTAFIRRQVGEAV